MRTDKRDGFSSQIEMRDDPSIHAFFLDIDGTLIDIADTPDRISVDAWLLDMVRRLHTITGGALALISGRPVAEVDSLFTPMLLPIAGQHGAERRDAFGGTHFHPYSAKQLDNLRHCILNWAVKIPELLVEDKGMSIAVHYRKMPQLAGEVRRILAECLEQCGDTFRLQEGKMVVELKPAGKDKGTAIIEFMNEAPFRGRIPVFIGDDVTDEHGFVAVNNLGGHSVKVGPGSSVARWRIPNVSAVRAWLEDISG